jgi:hypothetical protein
MFHVKHGELDLTASLSDRTRSPWDGGCLGPVSCPASEGCGLTSAKSVNRRFPSRVLRRLLPFHLTAPCVPALATTAPRHPRLFTGSRHRATTRRPRHSRRQSRTHATCVVIGRHTSPANLFAGSPYPRRAAHSRALSTAVRCTASCRAPDRPALHTSGSRTQCSIELGPDPTALSAVSPTTTTTVPDHVRRQPRSRWGDANLRPTDDRRARFLHRCARHRAVHAEKRQCFT